MKGMEKLPQVHSLQGEGSPNVNIGKSANKQILRQAQTVPCITFQSYIMQLCDGVVACSIVLRYTLLGRGPALLAQRQFWGG